MTNEDVRGAGETVIANGATFEIGNPDTGAPQKSELHGLGVLIRRVTGAPHVQGCAFVKFNTADDPHASGRSSYHHFGDEPGPFDLSADIAVAAVATGGFEVDPNSRVKLKKRGDSFVVEQSGEGE